MHFGIKLDIQLLNHLCYLLTIGFDKFYIQYEDNYLFRPNDIDYKTIEIVKSELLLCVPKKEWGMIWCK